MGPELKGNPEFTHWFEEWVARIQSRAMHEHEPPEEAASRKDEERRRQAEKEPVLKH